MSASDLTFGGRLELVIAKALARTEKQEGPINGVSRRAEAAEKPDERAHFNGAATMIAFAETFDILTDE